MAIEMQLEMWEKSKIDLLQEEINGLKKSDRRLFYTTNEMERVILTMNSKLEKLWELINQMPLEIKIDKDQEVVRQ